MDGSMPVGHVKGAHVHMKLLLTSSAVILLLGLNLRHLRKRSRASGGALGNMSERNRGFEGGSDSNMLAANGERMDSMSSAEGLPVT